MLSLHSVNSTSKTKDLSLSHYSCLLPFALTFVNFPNGVFIRNDKFSLERGCLFSKCKHWYREKRYSSSFLYTGVSIVFHPQVKVFQTPSIHHNFTKRTSIQRVGLGFFFFFFLLVQTLFSSFHFTCFTYSPPFLCRSFMKNKTY